MKRIDNSEFPCRVTYEKIEEIESKFGRVLIGCSGYMKEYSIENMPPIAYGIYHTEEVDDSDPYMFEFESIGTYVYKSEEEAETELVNKIRNFCDGKYGTNKTLVWRQLPIVKSYKDFEKNEVLYRGYCRLQIIPIERTTKENCNE